jgi:hypothetical protein
MPALQKKQTSGKKRLSFLTRILIILHPNKSIRIWAEDEARIGLHTIRKRAWVRKGSQPEAPSHQKYEWLYVYAFVEPSSGATCTLILPSVSNSIMTIAVDEFMKEVDPDENDIHIFLIDQA